MIDIHTIKAVLIADLTALEAELATIAQFDAGSGDWVAIPEGGELTEADENSEADAVETWNERRATVASLETIYRNTTRALQKIEAGTFGACEICSAAIEEDRLSALPTARTCTLHRDDEHTLPL